MASNKKGGFWKGVRSELKKISWPNKKETLTYTGVVILITLLTSGIIWLVDLVLRSIVDLIL